MLEGFSFFPPLAGGQTQEDNFFDIVVLHSIINLYCLSCKISYRINSGNVLVLTQTLQNNRPS